MLERSIILGLGYTREPFGIFSDDLAEEGKNSIVSELWEKLIRVADEEFRKFNSSCTIFGDVLTQVTDMNNPPKINTPRSVSFDIGGSVYRGVIMSIGDILTFIDPGWLDDLDMAADKYFYGTPIMLLTGSYRETPDYMISLLITLAHEVPRRTLNALIGGTYDFSIKCSEETDGLRKDDSEFDRFIFMTNVF